MKSDEPELERNLGEQPLRELMVRHGLVAQDLVRSSDEQVTHKMVARAAKGRRLTPNSMGKVLRALNAAAGAQYALEELFNYGPG